ncbi:MAG: RHS repeat protein, partial [Planctomycetota bacterium]
SWIQSADPPTRILRWKRPGGAEGELRLGLSATEPDAVRDALPTHMREGPPRLVLARLERGKVRTAAVLGPATVELAGAGPPRERERIESLFTSALSAAAPPTALDPGSLAAAGALARLGPQQVLEAGHVLRRDAAGRPLEIGAPDAPVTLAWDAADRLVFWRAADRTHRLWRHDARNRLVAIATVRGLLAQLAYDERDRLRQLEVAGVGTWRWVRDAAGRPLEVAGPDGLARRFAYGPTGGLRRVVDRAGQLLFERTALDGGGQRLRYRTTADAAWNEIRLDAQGQLLSRSGPEGEVRVKGGADGAVAFVFHHPDGVEQRLAHDAERGGWHLLQRGGDGTQTQLAYDALGRVLSLEVGDETLRVTYDEAGRVTEIAAPRTGEREAWRYDERGRPVERRSTGEPVERWVYDRRGRLERYERGALALDLLYESDGSSLLVLDAGGGQITELRVDARGAPLWLREPDGSTTAWRYSDGALRTVAGRFGRLDLEPGPNGELVRLRTAGALGDRSFEVHSPAPGAWFVRDTDGRSPTLRAEGADLVWEHPLAGRWKHRRSGGVDELSGPLGRQRVEYDPHGVLRALLDPVAGTARIERLAPDRFRLLDPAGAAWTLHFDALGALEALDGPLGHKQRWERAREGRIYIDPLGARWQRRWSDRGLVLTERDPLGFEERFELDPVTHELRAWQRPDGVRLGFEREARGTLLALDLGAGRRVTLVHDARGRLVRAAGPDGESIAVGYDALDRPIRLEQRAAPPLALGYEGAGPLAEIRVAGLRLRYDRDALGRLRELGVAPLGQPGRAHAPTPLRAVFAYDEAGRPLRLELPGGALLRYRYEGGRPAALEVVDAGGQITYFEHYRFDAAGRLLAVRDPDGEHRFRYDALGRLLEAQWADGSRERFRHDAAGNVIEDAAGARWRYDRAQRLVARGAARFEHDACGRLITDDRGRRYIYDALDRLLEVRLPDGGRVRFGYDAFGRLAWRERDGQRTRWLWCGPDPVAQLDGRGRVLRRFVPGSEPGLWLATRREQEGQGARGGWAWAVRTLNGSLVALVDGRGQVLARYRYRAYGGVRGEKRRPGRAVAPAFAGGIPDPELDLVFFGSRPYHTGLARFLTPEPEGHDRLGGRYVYGLANPLTQHDRTGASPAPVLGAGGGPGPAAWPAIAGIRNARSRRLVIELAEELQRIARTEHGPVTELARATLTTLRTRGDVPLEIAVKKWFTRPGWFGRRVREKGVHGLFRYRGERPSQLFLFTGPARGDRFELLKTLVHELAHVQQSREPRIRNPAVTYGKKQELEAFFREYLLSAELGRARGELYTEVLKPLGIPRTSGGPVRRRLHSWLARWLSPYGGMQGTVTPDDLATEIRRFLPSVFQGPRPRPQPELVARNLRFGVTAAEFAPQVDWAWGVQRQLAALRRVRQNEALEALALRYAEPVLPPSVPHPALEQALRAAERRALRALPLRERALRATGRLGAIALRMGADLLEPGMQALALYDAWSLLTAVGEGSRQLMRLLLENSPFAELLRALENEPRPLETSQLAASRRDWLRNRLMVLDWGGAAGATRSGLQARATARALGARTAGRSAGWVTAVPGRRQVPRRGGIVGALQRVGAIGFGGAGTGAGSVGTTAAAPRASPSPAARSSPSRASPPASGRGSRAPRNVAGAQPLPPWAQAILDDVRRRADEQRRAWERRREAERRREQARRASEATGAREDAVDDLDLRPPAPPARPGLVRRAWNWVKSWVAGEHDSARGRDEAPVTRTLYHAVNPYAGAAAALERALGPVLEGQR